MDTQEAINEGQKKINGQLCYVDRTIVETIKLLRLAIANSPVFGKIDFDKVDRSLMHAYESSAAVASVKPPGCEPPYYGDPKWSPSTE
jgi:hypothetical protein